MEDGNIKSLGLEAGRDGTQFCKLNSSKAEV